MDSEHSKGACKCSHPVPLLDKELQARTVAWAKGVLESSFPGWNEPAGSDRHTKMSRCSQGYR